MKLKYCIAALLLLCPVTWCVTQARSQVKYPQTPVKTIPVKPGPLSINDAVPDLPFNAISNASYANTSLFRLSGKIVILDFMATTCTGCIAALPGLDSLQAKYKDSLQLFLVTYEDAATVSRFLKNNALGRNTRLPVITADVLLSRWFPHSYLSHEVWITPAKKVLAITAGEYVNDGNIKQALMGRPVNWPLKRDINLADAGKPLIRFSDADSMYYEPPAAAYYTVISNAIKTRQVGHTYVRDSLRKQQRFYMADYPIIAMYLLAYDTLGLTTGHIILNVSDRQRFIYIKGVDYADAWDRDNRYCYESIMPLTLSEVAMRQKVREDLDRFFGLKNSFVMQQTNCWVLHDTVAVKNNDTITAALTNSFSITTGNLLYRLEHGEYGTPVLNESTATTETTIRITGRESIPELNAILIQYGLVISKLPRLTKMLTITKIP